MITYKKDKIYSDADKTQILIKGLKDGNKK